MFSPKLSISDIEILMESFFIYTLMENIWAFEFAW